MPSVNVTDTNGETETLDAQDGLSLMEVLRDANYPIYGECGGGMACATCHIIVADDWADKIDPISDDEEFMLDTVFNLEKHSRLGCQIKMSDALSGIAVKIPS